MNVVAVIFSCPEHFNREWSQVSLLSAPDHTPPSILKYMACGEMTRFKICFLQLYSTFILQGLHLKAEYGAITIPAAWPSLCEIVILLILVPVMERGVYPSLARCGVCIPILWRIFLGMLLAAGSAGMGMCCILCCHQIIYTGFPLHCTLLDQEQFKNSGKQHEDKIII